MAIKTIYGLPALGANLELLMMMADIKLKYDLKVVPSKAQLAPRSKWEAFAVNDLDEAEDSYYSLSILGTDLTKLKGPMSVSKHYGILSEKTVYDHYHYVVFRFTSKEKRDEVRSAFRVLDSDLNDVPNILDYLACGTDEEGYFFLVQRDKEVEETVVYTYTDDGQILKNNVSSEGYRNVFDQW